MGLPTYSGRGIELGTGSVGESTPADKAERTGMLTRVSVTAHGDDAGRVRPAEKPDNRIQRVRHVRDPATATGAVGGGRDDRSRPGQIDDEAVQLVAGAGIGHLRGAFLELGDVDQPERDRVVQAAQCAIAVGVGYPQFGQFVGTCPGGINLPPRSTAKSSDGRTVEPGQSIPMVWIYR